jgi:transcriptional regulator with XRE-family HTH domain
MTPPFDPQAVVLRIRTVVEMHGSIPQVVASCGLKQPTLEHILSGKSLPNAASLACLCRGLDVSADWILFGEVRG